MITIGEVSRRPLSYLADVLPRKIEPMPIPVTKHRDWLEAVVALLIVASVGLISLLQHSPFSTGLFAGAVLMVVQGWRTQDQQLMAVAALLPLFGIVEWCVNYGVILLTPHIMDAALARLDAGISVTVWHWCFSHPPLWQALSFGYNSLGFVAALAICAAKEDSEEA